MPRRAAPAAPSMPKSPTRIHVKGVQQHAAAASKRKAPMLVVAGAVLCLILGMTLLLWPAAVPDRHLSPSRHPFDQQSAARPLSHDVQGLLERAHKYLSLVDDWTYQPLGDAAQTRKYLTGHPRMSKHVSAFVQAAFQALPLPLEELGYSYLVCAAGGALAFDFFAGDVNLTQVVSPDFRHLTRKFTYRTSVRSVPDGDLIQACGPVIKMEPPAENLQLPYASKFDALIVIRETWNSTLPHAHTHTASQGATVSIKPFSQWVPATLDFSAQLVGQRDFEPWQSLYGPEHVQSAVGTERWQALRAIAPKSAEKLVSEVDAVCDLSSPLATARCMYPLTMYHGSGASDPPLITTGIYLEWQEVKWIHEDTL